MSRSVANVDFDESPFIVIWETTQACDLACLHCRAAARPARDRGELDTAEAMRLMETVRRFGRPLFVLTGGDPLKRDDTVALVAHGTSLGLRVAMTPSGTPLMTPAIIAALRDAGLARLAVSLDGSNSEIHDRFRGVAGSFDWTVRMLTAARELGLPTQINTTISRHNLHDLEPTVTLIESLGVAMWSVFFIVPTGRARESDLTTADEFERVFHRLYDLSATAPFDIKTTAAPHYRRVVIQRQVAERRRGERSMPAVPLTAGVGFSLADGVGRGKGVNDGNGFVFINHRGEIYLSGFLPVSAGNVRTHDLVAVYREHEMFHALRDPDRLRGKCGVCEFRSMCGGSRARAYATTGDYLEADPYCAYVPRAYARRAGHVGRPSAPR
ncbi:MAG TPA: TIGR04053 family radical SAM/SPASM domain-containing protein [Candidatus Elarobacter sp.]|nr:TIGR04053 family radical SAM/SPASM domain-containing protein [Candidatus Elarobacter sp.]